MQEIDYFYLTKKIKFTETEFNLLKSLTPFVKDETIESIRERKYCIRHKIKELPKCQNCGADSYFIKTRTTYSKSCGTKCKLIISKNNRENTNLTQWGVKTNFENPEIQERKKTTYYNNYGYFYPTQNPEFHKISQINYYKRTGFYHWSQNPEVQENRRQFYFNKTGFYHHFQNPEIFKKSFLTHLENTGFINPSQNPLTQLKMRKNCLNKTGYYHWTQTPASRTFLSLAQAKFYQEKRNEAGTDIVGVVYILHFPELKLVKIGQTTNFEARSRGLLRDFGKFEVINIIPSDYSFSLEYELHEKYSSARVVLEEGSGRTEFFKEEILNELY